MDDEIIDQYLQAPPPSEAAAPIATTSNVNQITEPVAGPSNAGGAFKIPAQPRSKDDMENERTDLDSELQFDSTALSQLMFLEKLTVHIHGFDKESHESLAEDCIMAGADVIEDKDYSGVVDLLILPVDAMTMEGIAVQAKCIVNHNWMVSAPFSTQEYSEVSDSYCKVYYLFIGFRSTRSNYTKSRQIKNS